MTVVNNEDILKKEEYFYIKDMAIKLLREREKNGMPKFSFDEATTRAGEFSDLTQEGRNILIINLLIPDDAEFIERYKASGRNLESIAQHYGISPQIAMQKVYEINKYQEYYQIESAVTATPGQQNVAAPVSATLTTPTSEQNSNLETESLDMIQELCRKVAEFRQTAVDQELTINSLQNTVTEQDRIIRSQNEVIAGHKANTSQLERKIAELEGKLQVANSVVANIHTVLRTSISQMEAPAMNKEESQGMTLARQSESSNQQLG